MTIPSEVLDTIRRIQILSNQLAKDVFSGAYRSAFKGKGMEFEEVREYQPGDDIRTIDWNVTARMNHPYVKNFREERDLTVILLVDVSASSRFGSVELKKRFIADLGAVLAFSAIKNNDRVGLILFSDIVEKYIPPRKGTRHVLRVIRDLLLFVPQHKGSNLKAALSFLGKVQVHSSICFIISDFFFNDYSHEASLVSQKHDLIGLCIIDPAELSLGDFGLVALTDLESGKGELIDSESDEVKTAFQKLSSQCIASHRKKMLKSGADFIELRTDRSYIPILQNFFRMRHRSLRQG